MGETIQREKNVVRLNEPKKELKPIQIQTQFKPSGKFVYDSEFIDSINNI